MSNPVEPLTYSLAECAALLKVSRRTLSNAVRDGQVPAIRIGGRVLVVRAGLERMLESAEVGA